MVGLHCLCPFICVFPMPIYKALYLFWSEYGLQVREPVDDELDPGNLRPAVPSAAAQIPNNNKKPEQRQCVGIEKVS